MDRCALFVDAGYVLTDGAMAVHGTRRRESVSWDYEGLLQMLGNVTMERVRLPLLRCYWYEATVEGRRSSEHDALADLPGVKLRMAKMRPGHREGVEGEMHRDLTTLARNKAVSDVMVVSAEEDLTEVIAEVQDMGMRVTLLHIADDDSRAVSRTLRQECDDIVAIGAAQLRPYVELIPGAEPVYQEQGGNGMRALPPAMNGAANGNGFNGNGFNGNGQQAGYPQAAPSRPEVRQPAELPAARQLQQDVQPAESGQYDYAPVADLGANVDYSASVDYGAAAEYAPASEYASAPDRVPAAERVDYNSGLDYGSVTEFVPVADYGPVPDYAAPAPVPVPVPVSGPTPPPAPAVQREGYFTVAPSRFEDQSGDRGPTRPPADINAYNPGAPREQYQQNGVPGAGDVGNRQPVPVAVPSDGSAQIRRLPNRGNGAGQGQPPLGLPSAPADAGLGQQPGIQQHPVGQPSAAQTGAQPVLPIDPSGMGYGAPVPPRNVMQGPNSGPMGAGPGGPAGPQAAGMQLPQVQQPPQMPPMPGGPVGPQTPLGQQMPGGPQGPMGQQVPGGPQGPMGQQAPMGQQEMGGQQPGPIGLVNPGAGYSGGPQDGGAASISLADAVQSAHEEGLAFGDSVARDAPALWLEAVLARKPRMPSDLEARLLQGSALPIDFLLHDEVRHALRRGFWDALERTRR